MPSPTNVLHCCRRCRVRSCGSMRCDWCAAPISCACADGGHRIAYPRRREDFTMRRILALILAIACQHAPARDTVLHAARLLDIDTGKIVSPGEVLVRGERIVAVG